jgi:DNA-binding transcriptional LysR family regulator
MASLENFRLVVFRTVAEQLSFRKAAEQLYLTQPAVSQQVKALEEELGVLLFDRSGTQAKLTTAGEILLAYARRSRDLLLTAAHEVTALSGSFAGQLTLGASTTIAQYVLPQLLSEFCREHPRVYPALSSGNTEQIVSAVKENRVALGFIEGPPHSRDVNAEPFLNDEIVLIVPASHDWARRERVPCRDIVTVPLVMRERGSGTRGIVEAALERKGIKRRSLHMVMELDSSEAIKSAVEAGFGAAFVSRWAVAKDARLGKSIQMVELEGVRIHRQFLAVRMKGPEGPGLAQEFRQFLMARSVLERGPRQGLSALQGNKRG